MNAQGQPPTAIAEQAAAIHREILRLLVLIAIAVGAFLLTRAIAANNRAVNARDAIASYGRGARLLEEGDIRGAIDSYRRAIAKNRADSRFVVALAQALERNGQLGAARTALLARRQMAPEDREVNLQLARLAARQGDAAAGVRYYQNALYAPWSPGMSEARRQVRIELIRFLLDHGRSEEAASQLVALSADLPPDPAVLAETGHLFLEAGDPRRALTLYQRALRAAPRRAAVLAAAGLAAFRAGDYSLAWRYLRVVPEISGDAAEALEVVRLMHSIDPLAAGIGSAVRRQRLIASLSHAQGRLTTCIRRPSHDTWAIAALHDEVQSFRERLARPARAPAEGSIEDGVALVFRLEEEVERSCATLDSLDRALRLVARHHGADER